MWTLVLGTSYRIFFLYFRTGGMISHVRTLLHLTQCQLQVRQTFPLSIDSSYEIQFPPSL